MANLHLIRTAWQGRRELLQLEQFIPFPCSSADLGRGRAPQHRDGELRFVGPRPLHKHPDRDTHSLWARLLPFQTSLGAFLVLALPLLQSTQAGTTRPGSHAAWRKRALNFSRLAGLPSRTWVLTTSPALRQEQLSVKE